MKYPKRSQYKYANSRYRVRNWAEYEAGLQRRGDLTVWLSDTALEAWRAPASGKPGGQSTYADLAIEAALTIGMVFHLDPSGQPIPAGPHHRASDLVEPGPGRAITTQSQDALQTQRAGAVLLTDDPPDRSEPEGQRCTRALEDRPRRHRCLASAPRAHPEPSSR